jgi:hypothetical protein
MKSNLEHIRVRDNIAQLVCNNMIYVFVRKQDILSTLFSSTCSGLPETLLGSQHLALKPSSISVTMDSQSSMCGMIHQGGIYACAYAYACFMLS